MVVLWLSIKPTETFDLLKACSVYDMQCSKKIWLWPLRFQKDQLMDKRLVRSLSFFFKGWGELRVVGEYGESLEVIST